jgi:hypothetical protein
VIAAITAYEAWREIAERVSVPRWANPELWPQLPLSWALVIVLALALCVIIEGSYRINGVRDKLHMRTLKFGRDLFAFLRECGPKPSLEPTYNSMEEHIEAAFEINGPYVEKIHYGYMKKFKERGCDLFLDWQEAHVVHNIESWEIDPPQVARAKTVKKIAEECLLISVRMDIERESKGT